MNEELAPDTWIRFVPLLPLGAAALHAVLIGLLRRSLSDRVAAIATLGAVGTSLLIAVLAFADLIGQTGQGAIVDRLGTWIGAGVGSRALVADWALRFDPLSAVMCLLVCGVGLLALVYAMGELAEDTRDDRGVQRFFALASVQIGAMLLLVLADDLLLLAAAWAVVGLATSGLLGFWYADPDQGRATMVGFAVGRAGDAALLGAIALAFWVHAEAAGPLAGFAGIEDARRAITVAVVRVPGWLGGGAIPAAELIVALLLVAFATRAAQLPFSGWLGEAVAAPTAALVLVHAVATVGAPVYIGARLAFLFVDAPTMASAAAWTGAATALVCALVACAQADALRVLAWSTASQLGYALVALGAAAPTAAVYQLLAHGFHKGLLLMTMGVAVVALGRERNLWRMGNLGSRLWRTRIDTWIGVLSLAGVAPFTIGFFSLEQVVVAAAAGRGVAGHGALTWTVLLAATATGFYAVRLIYLSLYGETRIPAHVRWEDLDDPGPVQLWPMGVLAALTVGGAVVGTPQIWADLVFTDVEDANSLHHFLAPALGMPVTPPIPPSEEWIFSGRAVLMTLLGGLPAVWLYLLRPDWLQWVSDRFGWVQRRLLDGLALEPALRRAVGVATLVAADRGLSRGVEARLVEGLTLRGGARLLHGVANGWLRRLQSGSVLHYAALATAAGLGVLVYLALAGRG